jgi:uncharacterized protein involved in response to NO
MTVLALGFRPFYLLAAAYGACALPLWVVAWRGSLHIDSHLGAYAWHAHEMLFGFAGAVIAGFLLTAARNWTGRSTASGARLGALVLLWLAGRVLNLTGPSGIAALFDAAFLPACAAVLAVPIVRSRNYRNLFVVPVLVALGLVNLLHHGSLLGWSTVGSYLQGSATYAGAGLIALLMTVIGGRVIPSFSANAVRGLRPRTSPALEWLVVGLMALLPVVDLVAGPLALSAELCVALFAIAGAAQLVRLAGWQPWRTRRNGLLLMLPLAYLWLPVYLMLRAFAYSGGMLLLPVALHALLVGGMASLMLAMMTRSALGHTGRPLRAGRVEIIAFWSMQAAALVRVAGPTAWPVANDLWIPLAGGLATLALATFAIGYWPILTRPRVDGRPG